MKQKQFQILFIILIVFLKISIISTLDLKLVPTEEQEGRIEPQIFKIVSQSTFGKYPYGEILKGPLVYMDSYLCDLRDIEPFENKFQHPPIVLINRGDCKFTTKDMNVHKLGGQAAIIIDNLDERTEYITLGDSGNGEYLQIPAQMVSLSEGQKIIKALENLEENEYVNVEMSYLLPQTEKAKVDLVIKQEQGGNSHEVLFNLLRRYQILQDYIELDINYVFLKYSPEYNGEDDENCLYDGEGKIFACCYSDRDTQQTGRAIAEEQLNQICVKQEYGDLIYLLYIQQQFESCFQVPNYDHCRRLLFKLLDIDNKKIEQCADISNQQTKNLLIKMMDRKDFFNVPTAFINGETYYGSFAFDNFNSAICTALTEPPEECDTEIWHGIFMEESEQKQSEDQSEDKDQEQQEESEYEEQENDDDGEQYYDQELILNNKPGKLYVDHDVIPVGMAEFGQYWYGKTVKSPLVISSEDGCNEFQGEEINSKFILMVDRGGCKFASKTQNAEKIGASMLIIADNHGDDDPEQHVLVSKFNSGEKHPYIPTVLISKENGDNLKQLYSNSSKEDPLNISFNMQSPPQTQTVDLEFWFDPLDLDSYKILKNIEKLSSTLNEGDRKLYIFPRFYSFTCLACDKNQFKKIEYQGQCLSGGRYCSSSPGGEGGILGRDVVKQYLRSLCTFKIYGDKDWLDSTIYFFEQCVLGSKSVLDSQRQKDLEDCYYKAVQYTVVFNNYKSDESRDFFSKNAQEKIEECVFSSYIQDENETEMLLWDNKILKEEQNRAKEYDILYIPTMYVNKMKLFGDKSEFTSIENIVCKSYRKDSKPKHCKKLEKLEKEQSEQEEQQQQSSSEEEYEQSEEDGEQQSEQQQYSQEEEQQQQSEQQQSEEDGEQEEEQDSEQEEQEQDQNQQQSEQQNEQEGEQSSEQEEESEQQQMQESEQEQEQSSSSQEQEQESEQQQQQSEQEDEDQQEEQQQSGQGQESESESENMEQTSSEEEEDLTELIKEAEEEFKSNDNDDDDDDENDKNQKDNSDEFDSVQEEEDGDEDQQDNSDINNNDSDFINGY